MSNPSVGLDNLTSINNNLSMKSCFSSTVFIPPVCALTVFDSDVSVDTPLASTLEVAVRTTELRRHATLKAQVSCHAVPVRVEALALRTLVLRLTVSVHDRDCLQCLRTCGQVKSQTPAEHDCRWSWSFEITRGAYSWLNSAIGWAKVVKKLNLTLCFKNVSWRY